LSHATYCCCAQLAKKNHDTGKINLAHGPMAWPGNRISVREKDKQAGNENHKFSMLNEPG
jgi:hypothetical protein